MTMDQAIASIERGIQTVIDLASETDIFAIGEMGIVNTTWAAPLCLFLQDILLQRLQGKRHRH